MMCYYRSLPRRSVATTTTLFFFDVFLIMLTLTTAAVKDEEISRRAVMIRARRQGCGTSACGYTCCIAIPQQLLQQIQQQQQQQQPQQQQQQQPQQQSQPQQSQPQQQPQPQQSQPQQPQPQQSTPTPIQTTTSITYTPTPSPETSTVFASNPQQCQCSLYETAASQSSQLQCQCAPTIMPNAVQTQCYCQQSSGSSSNSITQLPQPYQPCQCSSSIQQQVSQHFDRQSSSLVQSQAQPCQCIPSTNQPANQCICAPPSAGGYTQPYQQQSTPTPQTVYPPQTMMPATLPPPTPPPPSSPSTTIGNSITPTPIGSGSQPSNNVNNCLCGTSQSNLCCTPPPSSNPCLPICQSTCICADQSSTIGGTAIGSGAITTTSATLTTPQPTPPPATADGSGGISSTPYTFAPYTPAPAPIGSGVITSRPSPATVPCITFTINFPPGTGNSVGGGASTIASTCACQPGYVQCSSKTCCLRYRYRSRDLTGNGVETGTTNDAVATTLVKVVRPIAVKPMAVYDVIAQPSSIVQQHHPVTQPSPHSLIVKQNDAFARGKQLAKGLLNELLTYLG